MPVARRWARAAAGAFLLLTFAAPAASAQPLKLGSWNVPLVGSLTAWRESAGVTSGGDQLFRYWFSGVSLSFADLLGRGYGPGWDATYSYRMSLTHPTVGTLNLFSRTEVVLDDVPSPTYAARLPWESARIESTEPLVGEVTLAGSESHRACSLNPPSSGPLCDSDVAQIQEVVFIAPQLVPEPTTVVLLAAGLLTLAGVTVRRRRG